MKRSKEVFVGHPKVSAAFNSMLQRFSGCFKGVSPLKGINNALFQVPSSSQFQFPDVLEAEFRLDPEFRRRVVGLERMLRVRDSLQAKSVCETDLEDPVKPVAGTNLGEVGFSSTSMTSRDTGWSAAENDSKGQQVVLASGFSCASTARPGAGWLAAETDLEDQHASACESKETIGLHEVVATTAGGRGLLETSEPDFSKNLADCAASSWRSCSAHATACEREGIIRLHKFIESDFPPLLNSSLSLNSRPGSLSSACARSVARCVAAAPARVCSGSSSPAVSAAVAHTHASILHGALVNSWSDTVRLHGPTGTRRVKGGVSSLAEDLRPVTEVEAVNFRPAGRVRGQVAGSLPGRQPGTGTRTGKGSVVTPSLHPEVPDSLSVLPGPGKRIRQSMGWTKVCGTTLSGIWVLKGNARTCMFPANLDHLRVGWRKQGSYKTAWVTPGHDCLCSYKYGHGAAESDHKPIRPSGMELLVCGAGSRPSYHLGVVRRNCQRG